jgi:hypothetical protein
MVCIRHANIDRFSLFDKYIKKFIDGECRYRSDEPTELTERFFGSPPEWNNMRLWNLPVTSLVLSALRSQIGDLRSAIAQPSGWISRSKDYLFFLSLKLLGPRLALMRLQALIWISKARCYLHWFNPEPMYHAFIAYWRYTSSFCRVRYLIEHVSMPDTEVPDRRFYDVENIQAGNSFGFYGLEEYEGKAFRWSSSVSGTRLRLNPGNYELKISLLPVRPLTQGEVDVFVNRIRLPYVVYDTLNHMLRCKLSEEMISPEETWLLIFVRPLKSNNGSAADERRLGLPIISISCEPQTPAYSGAGQNN